MNNIKKVLFTTYPLEEKNRFIEQILQKNYIRSVFLSKVMIGISFLMYLISLLEDDLQIIKEFNFAFLLSSIAVFLFSLFIKPKAEKVNKKRIVLVIFMITTTLLWSSSLLAFVPNRYEMFGTYSLIILSISSILYLKWKFQLFLHLFSLFYIFLVYALIGDFFLSEPVIPKITVIISLNAFSFIIARVIYYKNLQNFELTNELYYQNEQIQKEVYKKTLELFKQSENQVMDLVFSMNIMLEQYTPYTKGHCEKVAELSKDIAEDLSMSSRDIKEVYWSGIIHDIGKLLVPLNILNKESSLTEDEFDIVKKHPVWAYNALKESDSLYSISFNVLHHHEYWDGKGYPYALSGDDIPIASQIISVADAWESMTSDRPYRKRLDNEQALRIIVKNKSKQFSPRVVESFLRVYQKKIIN